MTGRLARVPMGRRQWRALLTLCFTVLLCGMATVPLGAEDFDGIDFQCEPLFPNITPQGHWWPVRVSLENRSNRVRKVEVVISTRMSAEPSTVTWEVELSPGAKKREIVPAHYPPSRPWSPVVAGLSEAGEVLGTTDLGMSQRSTAGAILVITPTQEGTSDSLIQRLGGELFGQVPLGVMTRAELPSTREAYSGVSVFVLDGVGPDEFSAPQRDALLTALRRGATGFIFPGVGGEGNGWVVAPGAAPLRAVRHDRGHGEATYFLRPEDAAETVPEFVQTAEGLGSWQRRTRVGPLEGRAWTRFVSNLSRPGRGVARSDKAAPFGSDAGSVPWLRQLDRIYRSTVPVELVFIFIGVYVLIVGPGLFWYLRRIERLVWLLWLQPLVVVLFLGLVYVVGYVSYGIPAQQYQTVIVACEDPAVGEWAPARAVLSKYNSVAGTEDIRAQNQALPVHLSLARNDLRTQHWRLGAGGGRLSGFFLRNWSLTHFASDGVVRLGGGALRVRERDEDARVEIINEMSLPVRRIVFSLGRLRYYVAGPLQPGGKVLATPTNTSEVIGFHIAGGDGTRSTSSGDLARLKLQFVGDFDGVAEFDLEDLAEPFEFGFESADFTRALLLFQVDRESRW